jgi:hypothetical protein
MSETIETPTAPEAAPISTPAPEVKAPTPEEAAVIQKAKDAEARKAKEARINARIAELTALAGKTFARNDGVGLPVNVLKYAGIFIKDGIGIYTLAVETPGHAKWNAPATEFLANYHVIETPKTATSDEPI